MATLTIKELRAKWRKGGKKRWDGVSKKARSEAMKRVRNAYKERGVDN